MPCIIQEPKLIIWIGWLSLLLLGNKSYRVSPCGLQPISLARHANVIEIQRCRKTKKYLKKKRREGGRRRMLKRCHTECLLHFQWISMPFIGVFFNFMNESWVIILDEHKTAPYLIIQQLHTEATKVSAVSILCHARTLVCQSFHPYSRATFSLFAFGSWPHDYGFLSIWTSQDLVISRRRGETFRRVIREKKRKKVMKGI